MSQWIDRNWKFLAAVVAAIGSVLQVMLPNNTYILMVSLFCALIALYLVLDGLRTFRITIGKATDGASFFESIGEFWIKVCFLIALALLLFAGIFSIRFSLQTPEPPTALLYFKSWRVMPPHNFHAEVDTRPLVNFKASSRLMLACLWPDFTVDNLDNSHIEKSNLFEITTGDIGMQLAMSEEFMKSGYVRPDFLQCFLLLVPRSITPNEIQNLRQLVNAGGAILQPAGMGGFGKKETPKPEKPMSSPAPDPSAAKK